MYFIPKELMEEKMIKFKEVTKRYGTNEVLHSIDLEVPEGKTLILIGPSGCGKSTMLRMMTGLIEPTKGAIEFEGHKVQSKDWTGLRRRMGYVIQDGGLFPHFSARDNVLLMAKHLKMPHDQQLFRLKELCELTMFPEEGLSRYPLELSGGQCQRVSLMRALMLNPEVLLLDEPLGSLDPMVRNSLQSDLKNIFYKLKKTVVMVTHDMGEAAYLGDEIVLMLKGKIVQKGVLKDFFEHPADPIVTEFIHSQRGIISV